MLSFAGPATAVPTARSAVIATTTPRMTLFMNPPPCVTDCHAPQESWADRNTRHKRLQLGDSMVDATPAAISWSSSMLRPEHSIHQRRYVSRSSGVSGRGGRRHVRQRGSLPSFRCCYSRRNDNSNPSPQPPQRTTPGKRGEVRNQGSGVIERRSSASRNEHDAATLRAQNVPDVVGVELDSDGGRFVRVAVACDME